MSDSGDAAGSRATRLRNEVRRFLAGQNFRGLCDSWIRGHNPDFSREVGARGWIGMTWPKEFGGGGESNVARWLVAEELLRAGAPVAAHWTADRQIGPALIRHANPALRDELLPAIRRGEVSVGLGISEPDAGSDLAALRTRADRVDGGWEITGSKIWTTSAHVSSLIYVLARTDSSGGRHDGLTEFLVDKDTPGLEIRPILDLGGEHHFNEMFFDRVFVPGGRVLGEVGAGWQQITEQLGFERGGPERYLSTYPVLVAMIDAARRSPDRAARERIGALAGRLVGIRRMGLELARELDTGAAPTTSGPRLKLLGTLFEQDLVKHARYVFSVCDATEAERATFEDARRVAPSSTIRGGTSEIMRTVIARAPVQPIVFSGDLNKVLDGAFGADGHSDEGLMTLAKELDLLSIGVPEEDGGPGGMLCDQVELAASLGRNAVTIEVWESAHEAWANATKAPEEAVAARRALLRAAAILGALDRVVSLTAEHITTREQFGRPLVSMQAVGHAFADMVLERERVRAAVDEALERPVPAVMYAARASAGEAAERAAASAHQLHGAMGVTQEHQLHRFTALLWAWCDADESQSDWELRLGDLVCEGTGDDALWSVVTGD